MVDTVARASGAAVDVYGHSFGAACALGGAMLSSDVGRLAVYEPPVAPITTAYPPGSLERLDGLLAEGRRGEAAEAVFRDLLGISTGSSRPFAPSPRGPRASPPRTRSRASPEVAGASELANAARITAPTLLLTGEHSPNFLKADIDALAETLPDARVLVLEGQEHVADVLAPDTFAGHLIAFLRA